MADAGYWREHGLGLVALGAIRWAVAPFLFIIVVGASQTAFRAANNTSIFDQTPKALQGRVISFTLLETGLHPLASVMAGAISDFIGVSVALMFLGVGCLLIVGTIGMAEPRIRRL